MCTSKKNKYISKNWPWFVGYLTLCANRNMLKKHISASPTVSFSASTFKTFVNYLKMHDKEIHHFDLQHISLF